MNNIILDTDAYKVTHSMLTPKDVQVIYSYLESRGGQFDYTVFFGLQYIIKKHLEGQVVTREKIDQAEQVFKNVFGYDYFNKDGWEYILEKHNGYLPIRIKAVDEGTQVPVKNVLMTIENTDENVPWLTNYIESLLLQVWYPTTVATLSRETKRIIGRYAKPTQGEVSPFHLNDFGYRGTSTTESAMVGGAAHLLSFLGTDTIPAIDFINHYYHGNNEPFGHSVVASEHSVSTLDGPENEQKTYERFFDNVPDDAIISIVSDSYDYYNAVDNIFGVNLKERILNRAGRTVIRPDSGDPVKTTIWTLESLAKNFGAEQNESGFYVLNEKIGILWGDGIDIHGIEQICNAMYENGFSVDGRNVIFGMGGGLLQKVNRDTQKFAIKCSAVKRNDQWKEVYKQPVDQPDKRSKKGILELYLDQMGKYKTEENMELSYPKTLDKKQLKTVFENGKLLIEHQFKNIRNI